MDAPTMHNSLATMPLRKTKVDDVGAMLCLPDGKRIIVHSYDGSLRVRDLETGTQVGEEWEDERWRVVKIALSPDGKKVASGSSNGAVKLHGQGHTDRVTSLSWSPDGGRVVSGSLDGMFRVWDVDSGKIILGPINTGDEVEAVCYSPDAKMIATGGYTYRGWLKIWDANSGELLKTFKGVFSCLVWSSDGKTLVAGGSKIDTATWTKVKLYEDYKFVHSISLSPNDRILATTSYPEKTVQLWDLETNLPIGTPFDHSDRVDSATFSVDGKFLLTCCDDDHIYTWDVSAIVKEAGLPSHILDVTPRPAPKIKGARVPPGFFDDALREANLRIRLSQSHAHAPPTPTPHQRTFNPFTSVLRPFKPHGATESATLSRSQPFSWTRNISGMLRRRDRSDIQLREVEVPCTAGQPRNYHAGKGKNPVASSSRPSNTHTTQQHSAAIQSTSSSLPAANTSSVSAVAGTPGTIGAPSRPPSPVTVWRARFVRWLCCAPI
ncbi:WD40 repeat-like protein [Suillus brevipes Sb2]|nr:WD40 repeat-like protein [Suillus brevipes Sb2]